MAVTWVALIIFLTHGWHAKGTLMRTEGGDKDKKLEATFDRHVEDTTDLRADEESELLAEEEEDLEEQAERDGASEDGTEDETAERGSSTALQWRRRRVVKPGMVISLHNTYHNRFMRMNDKGEMVTSVPCKADALPKKWSWVRFAVVDAGRNRIALHSSVHNRFVMLERHRMTSIKADADKLNLRWVSVIFSVVEQHNGQLLFYNPFWKRFIRMTQNAMVASGYRARPTIPSSWGWEPLTLVQDTLPLRPGDVVALHSTVHNRFLRMGQGIVDSGDKCDLNAFPLDWHDQHFRVVDAGDGHIALYNEAARRFIKIGSGTASPVIEWDKLRKNWAAERFTVFSYPKDEIGFYNQYHKVLLSLSRNGKLQPSPKTTTPGSIPGGWTWERFGVFKVRDGHLLAEWVSLTGKAATQSSTAWGGLASKPLTIVGRATLMWRDSKCTHTFKDRNAWWEVDLGAKYSISMVRIGNRADCCGYRLNGFNLLVDGKACASNVPIGQGETKLVPCEGVGSKVKVQIPKAKEFLTICEFGVFGSLA